MASLKAEKEKPSETQGSSGTGQAKKEPPPPKPKPGGTASKGSSSKLAPKKPPQKSQDSKRKVFCY